MTPVVGLVLPYDSDVVVPTAIDGDSDDISRIVGGMIEMVRLSPDTRMYINEEAKLQNPPLPRNNLVMRVLEHTPYQLPKPNITFHGPLGEGVVDSLGNDFIAGHAVILGTGDAPDEADAPEEAFQWCVNAGIEIRYKGLSSTDALRRYAAEQGVVIPFRNMPLDGSMRRVPKLESGHSAFQGDAMDYRGPFSPEAIRSRTNPTGRAVRGNPYAGGTRMDGIIKRRAEELQKSLPADYDPNDPAQRSEARKKFLRENAPEAYNALMREFGQDEGDA